MKIKKLYISLGVALGCWFGTPEAGAETGAAEIPAGKARVVLQVDVEGDPYHGYQMWLDSRAEAYEKGLSSGNLPSGLSRPADWKNRIPFFDTNFDARIPKAAVADSLPEHVVLGGSDTLDIEAGIYDVKIVYYYLSAYMYDAYGSHTAVDDMAFEEGRTYLFRFGKDGGFQYFPPREIGLSSLILPSWGHDLGRKDTLAVDVFNGGTEAVSDFRLYYAVKGKDTVSETVKTTVLPGDTIRYVFAQNPDFSDFGILNVSVWVEMEEDVLGNNNFMSASLKHPQPRPLPFHENFESPDSLSHWNTYEITETYPGSWSYVSATGKGASESSGFIRGYTSNTKAALYLVSDPFSADTGMYHVSFHYTGGSLQAPEIIEVLYGFSPDVAGMESLGEVRSVTTPVTVGPPFLQNYGWEHAVFNFRLPADSVYYFAFLLKTENGARQVWLDEVTFGKGKYDLLPDLQLVRLLLPLSYCGLGSEDSVGVVVRNAGKLPMNGYVLSVSTDSRHSEWYSESFSDTLAVGISDTAWFSHKFDFSSQDSYPLWMAGNCEMQDNFSNDTLRAVVRNGIPYRDLPFVSDFSDPADTVFSWLPRGGYGWKQAEEGYWYPESASADALESVCLYLEPGIYRLNLAYGYASTDVFNVGFRLSDKDSLTVLFRFTGDGVTSGERKHESLFEVTYAGDYVFAFDPETAGGLKFYSFMLSKPYDYDIRISDFTPLVSSRNIPESQTGGNYKVLAAWENRGLQAVEQTEMVIYTGNGNPEILPFGDTLSFYLPLAENGMDIEVKGTIRIKDREDGDTTDNTMRFRISVNDTVMASEMAEFSEMQRLEGFFPGIFTGNIYALVHSDTLSSLTVGFAKSNAPEAYDLIVSTIDTANGGWIMGDTLFLHEVLKNPGDTMVSFAVARKVLDPGMYFLGLKSKSSSYNYLGQKAEDGFFFTYGGSAFIRNRGQNMVLRANFGSAATSWTRTDCGVHSILGPADSTKMSANEKITVKVANYGEADLIALPVHCRIDGVLYTDTIPLKAATAADVVFDADFSVPGLHEVLAFVAWPGDENLTNDTLSRAFVCVDRLGSGDEESWEFELYPNPVRECLQINSSIPIRHIEIFSLQGRKILSVPVRNTVFSMDAGFLPTGIYLLRMVSDSGTAVRKLIVEH